MFLILSLFFIGFVWLSYFLTLLDVFYGIFLVLYLVLFAFFLYKKNNKIKLSLKPKPIYIILLMLTIFFSSFTTPTIFTGRDQGSISQAAIRLAQNHQLEFSTPISEEFFQIYGQGKALNFPGFYYTQNGNLIPQFPLVYITWLASFYLFFGLIGFSIANGILFYIFLITIYKLFLRFSKESKFAHLLLVFILTSFTFSWFLKFTLTENLALALLWLSIYFLAIFNQTIKKKCLIAYFATSFLLVFTRIEGIAFLLAGIIILFTSKRTRTFLKSNTKKNLLFPLIIFVLIWLANFIKNFYFYKELVRDIFKSGNGNGPETFSEIFLSPASYMLQVYSLYGFIGFFIIGGLGILYFWKKKKYSLLLPFFVVLPSFVYLIDSNISSDHPWMLRRFMFSILPVFIFYSTLIIQEKFQPKKKKILTFLVIAILIFSNMPAFIKYLTFSENQSLLNQTKELSQRFDKKDLILIDQEASGDNWAMLPGPMNSLYGKNAVYFFNPKDLDKIDKEKFENIYIITPKKNLSFYTNSITIKETENYHIKTKRLEKADKENRNLTLPDKKTVEIEGKILEVH